MWQVLGTYQPLTIVEPLLTKFRARQFCSSLLSKGLVSDRPESLFTFDPMLLPWAPKYSTAWHQGQPDTCVSLPAVLQLFCSSPKAALRYAAVRTLNKVRGGGRAGLADKISPPSE